MLRKFKIAIDGKEYLVEMEEIGGVQQPVQAPVAAAPAAPVAAPAAPAEQAAPAAAPVSAASGDAMTSPMPGTILRVLVNIGDEVKENQPLMILEAMKMENSLGAPCDGTVKALCFGSGDSVAKDTVLAVIG